MAKIKGTVLVDEERCKGCGVCIPACPTGVLAFDREVNSKGYHFIRMAFPEKCIGCANCAIVCPDSCLTVFRKKTE